MSKKIVGYTTGVYDMFHVGHLHLLKRAKNHCDYLIVGVSTDDLVMEYKKKLPIIPFEHRLEIISSLKFVDEVVAVSHRDKEKAYLDVGYDVLFVGDDWKGSQIFNNLERFLKKNGARIEYFPYTQDVSSTKFTDILTAISSENFGS
ncbi:glycerol-3-phosphate cytidylyltransferase [Candidatus Francisella endociliophora]|uniref:Glycerol-3-phosphate cytidylyltransferase n=1 Tax=Candidatus Francisella endociliophora TaxID=653937 RepID=A0A097ER44_9GAMM|nr:adenylyltransferase/cytidyltransferase family protein [Francisella sp. FSC1006]AIT10012.1 glycerol-3-phosphate cytidylyltransferase [Francisella sp. FSC1006]